MLVKVGVSCLKSYVKDAVVAPASLGRKEIPMRKTNQKDKLNYHLFDIQDCYNFSSLYTSAGLRCFANA